MAWMAQTKRTVRSRPKPRRATARSKRRRKQAQPHHNAEIVGLGLVAVGIFLACVLWFGLSGGPVARAVTDAIGWGAYVAPVVLCPVGALIVTRSALVSVRPFRFGLTLAVVGLMLALGESHGGFVGKTLESLVALGVGSTGSRILGILLTLVGVLFLTGASLGALVRRSGHAVRTASRTASTRVRRERQRRAPAGRPLEVEPHTYHPPAFEPPARLEPPVDAVQDYPDIVSEAPPAQTPQLVPSFPTDDPTDETQGSLFESEAEPVSEYRLPDRSLLKKSKAGAGPNTDANARTAEVLLQCLANFGVEATVIGKIAGPRVTRFELQLAAGIKVAKVAQLKDDLSYALATTEIRILAPIPGKQAVGVEVPNLSPNLVTLGDIFDDVPPPASPLSVWLGKDISGAAVWADLARMPHLLIAGTTGSGKSGCINTILTSILLRSTPTRCG